MGLGTFFGTGSQYMPWIHLDDLCNIYLQAIEDSSMTGAYNAVAPEHITNRQFMQTLVLAMHKEMRLHRIPASVLKLALGSMSEILLEGSRISAEKLIASGYEFHYPVLQDAIDNLLQNNNL